jgi:hypothetical protein
MRTATIKSDFVMNVAAVSALIFAGLIDRSTTVTSKKRFGEVQTSIAQPATSKRCRRAASQLAASFSVGRCIDGFQKERPQRVADALRPVLGGT